MIGVAVLGANGKMGSEAVKAVLKSEELQLVAQITAADSLNELIKAGAPKVDVIIDFTLPKVTKSNVLWAIEHGIHCVVGASGWDEAAKQEVAKALEAKPEIGVLIAPNFSIAAVLAQSFAKQATRFFESAEIIELHHPQKVDAPSATATHTAQLIAAQRQHFGLGEIEDATELDPLGARGAKIAGINVHALRLKGLVAHQEVLFGNDGELFTIRHDSFSRSSFMPGVILAVKKISKMPGLTVGLEAFLEI